MTVLRARRLRTCFEAMACTLLALLATDTARAAAALPCDEQWSIVETSLPGPLADVAATRDGQVWTVGTASTSGASHGFAAHRDASGTWTTTRLGSGSSLRSVAATGGEVWAVGTRANGAAAILRWTGAGWRIIRTRATAGVVLTDVDLTSHSNVWVSGTATSSTDATRQVALHFDGLGWHRLRIAPIGFTRAVDTVSATNTWVIGSDWPATYVENIWHWNGTTWRRLALPDEVSDGGFLGLDARRDGRLWAVGVRSGFTCCDAIPVAVRRTSTGLTSASQYPPGDRYNDVVIDGWLRATAVGEDFQADSTSPNLSTTPIIVTWDHGTWVTSTIEGFTQPPTDSHASLQAIDGAGRAGQWAVGFIDEEPLVIHRC